MGGVYAHDQIFRSGHVLIFPPSSLHGLGTMRQCSFWAARQRGSEAARQRGSGAARQRDSEAAGLRGCGAAGLRGCGAAWLRGCEAARRTSPLCVGYHRRSRRSLIRYRYHYTLQVFEKYFTSTQMYFESVMNTTLLASTTVGSSFSIALWLAHASAGFALNKHFGAFPHRGWSIQVGVF